MKPAAKVVLSSVAATSAMTFFSYMVSDQKNKNFREPELLADFFESVDVKEKISLPSGWVTHYLIGAGFAAGYKLFLKFENKKATFRNGLFYGAIAGLTGILSWQMLFQNQHGIHKTNKKGFYAQLIIAHIIFGLTLAAIEKPDLENNVD
ncbi:hypothetical protein [Dyadobacter sp. CY356]|uniref:hypothetical protein n=1 Tax=Dyadobacter sp. CY356 TaxID=2906442 RepID=UPI001F35C46E|nr:hypothetical protein [Dyadobacter sp. CY356]MCF0054522.1 hypothetical protein [Dyadobacter sp. CY356]